MSCPSSILLSSGQFLPHTEATQASAKENPAPALSPSLPPHVNNRYNLDSAYPLLSLPILCGTTLPGFFKDLPSVLGCGISPLSSESLQMWLPLAATAPSPLCALGAQRCFLILPFSASFCERKRVLFLLQMQDVACWCAIYIFPAVLQLDALLLISHQIRIPWHVLSGFIVPFLMKLTRIYNFKNSICVFTWLMSIQSALTGSFMKTSIVFSVAHLVSSGSNTALDIWYCHLPCWIKAELQELRGANDQCWDFLSCAAPGGANSMYRLHGLWVFSHVCVCVYL